MPTYSYACRNCGSEFEKIQKFTDKPVTKCPVCGKGPVQRVFQPAAIVFKGSGWYATDHRSPSGGNGRTDKSDKSETAKAAEPAASKTDGDAKPAKTESKVSKSED